MKPYDFNMHDIADVAVTELKAIVTQHVERTAAEREAEFRGILQDVERRLAALEAKVRRG